MIALARSYVARGGAPVIRAVDSAIFRRRYFGHCLRCDFCGDDCCRHGVDVSLQERDRILAHADALEPIVGVRRDEWFLPTITHDAEFPGGASTRTAVVDGGCAFLRRRARGCALHAFALEKGLDYHDLKPMVSALFPLTFGEGVLRCSSELRDSSLICAGAGPTAYGMTRAELAYYFGEELVEELDRLSP